MSAFGRFCWKSRRWKSVKFYTCFDASVLERREGPHSPRPTYSLTITLALRHVCSIVGHFFPARRNFCSGRKSDFFNRIGQKQTSRPHFCIATQEINAHVQAVRSPMAPMKTKLIAPTKSKLTQPLERNFKPSQS